jgi:serine/threonine protein kinase
MDSKIQVLGHVGERIAELHDAGYAHRDLKPGNIMWQPRTYTWVLIDFGLAAPLDEDASVGFTPTYAAPEMVIAHLQGKRVVKASASVDAWSLGVIAFELLVQRHPFGLFATKDKVFSPLLNTSLRFLPYSCTCFSTRVLSCLLFFMMTYVVPQQRLDIKFVTFCFTCSSYHRHSSFPGLLIDSSGFLVF